MTSNLAVYLGILIALALAALVLVGIRRRRRRDTLEGVLAAIGIASRTDVSLPDGSDGQIHLERLIFTARGLLVLNVKPIAGVIFASDGMAEWTAITNARRFTFRNPQPALLDRVAALKRVARNVPVEGYVVFLPGADFSKGRPSYVIQPDELAERYAKPARAELERVIDAFSPQWERVLAACEPSFRLAG